MKVLVTGDRNWDAPEVIRDVLCTYAERGEKITLIHGKCPTGADEQAGKIASGLDFEVVECPAEWDRYGLPAGPIRNREMVEMLEEGDAVEAFHDNLSKSLGTKGCVRLAHNRGFDVTLHGSDGSAIVLPAGD